jgi:hypothetical protein
MVFYDLNVPWNVTLPTAESPSKNNKKQKGKPAAVPDSTSPKGLALLSESNQASLKACLDMLIHRMPCAILPMSALTLWTKSGLRRLRFEFVSASQLLLARCLEIASALPWIETSLSCPGHPHFARQESHPAAQSLDCSFG